MADFVKVSLNLTPAEWAAVAKMAEEKGLTKTDVIRRAIGTQKYFSDAVQKNEKILVKTQKGDVREVVLT